MTFPKIAAADQPDALLLAIRRLSSDIATIEHKLGFSLQCNCGHAEQHIVNFGI